MQYKLQINLRLWTKDSKWTYEWTFENYGLTQCANKAGSMLTFNMLLNFDKVEIRHSITDYWVEIWVCKWYKPNPNLCD